MHSCRPGRAAPSANLLSANGQSRWWSVPIHLPRLLGPCGDTLFLRGLPSETKPALFPENESDCRFVPLPSTTASRQENPPSSFFFYPLFMSPVALDQDPRKANPTPRGGGRVTARPVFARSFFLAESDPAVLLSCQIFLHAQQIALAGTLNNPQQLSHRGDLLQLL